MSDIASTRPRNGHDNGFNASENEDGTGSEFDDGEGSHV
jgi:hypothetical protein